MDFDENQPLYYICIYVCRSAATLTLRVRVTFTTARFHSTACRRRHRATSGQQTRFGSLFLEQETSNRVDDFRIMKASARFLSDDSKSRRLAAKRLSGWHSTQENRSVWLAAPISNASGHFSRLQTNSRKLVLSVADIGLKFCLSIVTTTTTTTACCRVDRDHHSSLVCEPTSDTT